MGFDGITSSAIEAIALPRREAIVFVQANHFDQPLKATEKRWPLVAQIYQYVIMVEGFALVVDDDRRFRRDVATRQRVGQETDCRCSPQHLIEFGGNACVGCEDQDFQFALIGLRDKLAHDVQLVADVGVEVDLGHGLTTKDEGGRMKDEG